MKSSKPETHTICFCPGGGFGDMIVSLPILDWLLARTAAGSNIAIDIAQCQSVTNYEAILGAERRMQVRYVFPDRPRADLRYFVVVNCNEMVNIRETEMYNTLFPIHYQRRDKFGRMAYELPKFNNQLAQQANILGFNRVTLPQWSMGMPEPYQQPKISVEGPRMVDGPYVTINDGWQAMHKHHNKAWKGWQAMVDILRKEGIKVVQVGSDANGQAYDNVDVSYRGQLILRDSFRVLRDALCHVDIEGGLVHAATALGTRCVVLHGPTNLEFFSYAQNINLPSKECSNCWWLNDQWAEHCIRADARPICMRQPPEEVAAAVMQVVNAEREKEVVAAAS